MSYLPGILNRDEAGGQPEIRAVDTQMVLEPMFSSEDEDMTPASDEEIDELEEETEEDEDYAEQSPSSKQSIDSGNPDMPEIDGDVKVNGAIRLNVNQPKSRKLPAARKKVERHDRRIDLGLLDHKAHPDCPDTLACLPDTNGRPQHTLPVILRCAILGSPRKRLTIREIYATMEAKYPYYKTAGQTWKQSVRHHLSLNRLFERQPRPVTDPGFGSYWTVNLLAPPGTKRPRKRGRQNKGDPSQPVSLTKVTHFGDGNPQLGQPTKFQFQPQTHPPPPPPPLPEPQVKSFSNPRAPNHYQTMPTAKSQSASNQDFHKFGKESSQHALQDHTFQNRCSSKKSHKQHNISRHDNSLRFHHSSHFQTSYHSHSELEGDKQRGFQPFRSLSPGTPTSGHDSTYPLSSKGSEPDDHNPIAYEDNKAPFVTVSEDEFESEEDMSRNREACTSISTTFVPNGPSPVLSLPTLTGTGNSKDEIIEHMRQEIANLRRTSAEAVSTSIRLSEQLANAHLEVVRCREVTRELEEMLQDEGMKRRDAERLKEVEADRRRAAEQALSSMAIHSPSRIRQN